jgi:hypothetical protein
MHASYNCIDIFHSLVVSHATQVSHKQDINKDKPQTRYQQR